MFLNIKHKQKMFIFNILFMKKYFEVQAVYNLMDLQANAVSTLKENLHKIY